MELIQNGLQKQGSGRDASCNGRENAYEPICDGCLRSLQASGKDLHELTGSSWRGPDSYEKSENGNSKTEVQEGKRGDRAASIRADEEKGTLISWESATWEVSGYSSSGGSSQTWQARTGSCGQEPHPGHFQSAMFAPTCVPARYRGNSSVTCAPDPLRPAPTPSCV